MIADRRREIVRLQEVEVCTQRGRATRKEIGGLIVNREGLLWQQLGKVKLSVVLAPGQQCFQTSLNRIAAKFPQRIGRNPSRRPGFERLDLGGGLDGK